MLQAPIKLTNLATFYFHPLKRNIKYSKRSQFFKKRLTDLQRTSRRKSILFEQEEHPEIFRYAKKVV